MINYKEYNKQYNLKNKDRIREYNKKYYSEHKDKMREYNKQYNSEHKDKMREYNKQYKLEHKAEITKYRLQNKEKLREISIKYKIDNPDKIKQFYLKNKDKIKEQVKQYKLQNGDVIRGKNKKYRLQNIKKINTYHREYRKIRRKNDLGFKLRHYLSTRIWFAIKQSKKTIKTMDLVGCSLDYLKDYLECQFDDEMSWTNYGAWHIDHIIPCASFDLTNEEEQRKCFHYSNLQPLWASDNFSKGAKT